MHLLPPNTGEEEITFIEGPWRLDAWEHINLNVRDYEPFQDKRARQTLMLGIDRQRLIEEIEKIEEIEEIEEMIEYRDLSYLPHSPRHPLTTIHVMEEICKYQYDPLQAKILSTEARFGPGGEELYKNYRTTEGNIPRENGIFNLRKGGET